MITVRDFVDGKAALPITGHGSQKGWLSEVYSWMMKDHIADEQRKPKDDGIKIGLEMEDLAIWKTPR